MPSDPERLMTTRWEVVSKRTGEVWATTDDPNYLNDWVTRDNFVMRPVQGAIGIVERLRAWPAVKNGDALNAAYVGKLMVQAADEIERQKRVMAEAHSLLDERMGDTDPADPDDPLLRAAQLLAEAVP